MLCNVYPYKARLFLSFFKCPGGPPLISGTIKVSPMKLCTVIVLLKAYQNTKEILRNMTYDVTMTSLLKTMGNSDLHETNQIIYQSKGNNKSFPKM